MCDSHITEDCITDEDLIITSEVMLWSGKDEEWVEVGNMKVKRDGPAVTRIMSDDPVMEYCN